MQLLLAGPVLESLLGMKGLNYPSVALLEDSGRGPHGITEHGARGAGREGRAFDEEEVGEGSDKLSPLPSYTASQKASVQVRSSL